MGDATTTTPPADEFADLRDALERVGAHGVAFTAPAELLGRLVQKYDSRGVELRVERRACDAAAAQVVRLLAALDAARADAARWRRTALTCCWCPHEAADLAGLRAHTHECPNHPAAALRGHAAYAADLLDGVLHDPLSNPLKSRTAAVLRQAYQAATVAATPQE